MVKELRKSFSKKSRRFFKWVNFPLIYRVWIVIWISHFIVYIYGDIFLEPRYGNFIANVIQYLFVLPLYVSGARVYVVLAQRYNYRSYPWIVGMLWALSSLLVDYISWVIVLRQPPGYVGDQFKVWEGNFYTIHLFGLLIAPPVMRKFRRYFRKDPFINLVTKGKFLSQ